MRRKPIIVGLAVAGVAVAYLLLGRGAGPPLDLAAAPPLAFRLGWAFDPPHPAGPPVRLFGLTNQVVLTLCPADGPPRAAVFDLDKRSGRSRWAFDAGGTLRPPTDTGESLASVLVGDAAGRLFALDHTTGRQRWEQPVGGTPGTPSVTLGREVFLPTGEAGLRKLKLETGERVWAADLGATAVGRLQSGSDRVFVLGRHPQPVLAAVHIDTGEVLWRSPLPRPAADGDFWAGDGVIVVPLADDAAGGLVGFDPATGKQLWYHELPGPTALEPRLQKTAHPVTGTRTLLPAATADGTVAAVDAHTGRVYWSVRLGVPVVGPPAFAWFYVFAVTADGRLVALDEKTGAAVGVCDLAPLVGGRPLVLAAEPGPRTFLVVEADGPAGRRVRVVKLDYADGLAK